MTSEKIQNLCGALVVLEVDEFVYEVLNIPNSGEGVYFNSFLFMGLTPQIIFEMVKKHIDNVDDIMYEYIMEFAKWKNKGKDGDKRDYVIGELKGVYTI